MTRLTAVSLFSGCGGFDLGAQVAGVKVLWANDIDKAAATAYAAALPTVEFVNGDIRSVKEFPRADVLIGCYPCTGFSLGARRRWRSQEERDLKSNHNNYLYRQFLRALRYVQPNYFFVENVRGLVTAEDGWFLDRQIDGFRRHGYRVRRQILDAKDYGVPQSRRRLFIVGVRAGGGALDYEFPRPQDESAMARGLATLRDAIWDMKRWPRGEYFDYAFHGHYLTRQRKRGWDEPSFTVVADLHHVALHPMGRPMKYLGKDRWSLQDGPNRRLSWRECARLQGLPEQPFEAVQAGNGATLDGYQTLRHRYRVIGNAVPPALAAALVRPVVLFEAARTKEKRAGQR